jgi:MFS family permease
MTQVGVLFAVFSLSSFLGAFPGGALTDRFGRKGIIIFSLVSTSLSTLFMGFVNEFQLFLLVAFISGIFTDVGGPAYESVFMDILPEQKRASGFGIRRVAFNLAVVLGPVIGGLIAARSYLGLFISDAVISGIVAVMVFLLIAETKPPLPDGKEPESMAQTFGGYSQALRDNRFMLFTLVSLLTWLIYANMSTTLGVFLRDQHGISESGYGSLISINAAMVVLLQFAITRRAEKNPPLLMMALGTFFITLGLLLYGFVSTFWWFAVAIAILTIGEMLAIPVSNAIVADFSPEDMRGRYNFVYGNSWGIAYAAGPYLAGLILDNTNPNWLWYSCGVLGMIAVFGFLALHWTVRTKPVLIRQE